eukprot:6608065-Prorocentrum_lima.AAC.1
MDPTREQPRIRPCILPPLLCVVSRERSVIVRIGCLDYVCAGGDLKWHPRWCSGDCCKPGKLGSASNYC